MDKRPIQPAAVRSGWAGLALLAGLGVALVASAQEPMVYPAQGQSSAQMAADKSECQAWATQETAANPAGTPQTPPPSQGSKGEVLRGGAKGAAAGAAIGAIAGNAGKGAAIGATAGGFKGAGKRRDQQQQAGQAQAEQSAQAQTQKDDAFRRAYAACLKGRGYSVE